MSGWKAIAGSGLLLASGVSAAGAGVGAQATQTAPAGAAATAPTVAAVKLLAWDVVSVKPVEAQNCKQGSGMRMTTDGVNIFCIPLLFVIEQAYRIMEPSRIVGAPEWVKSSGQYDIDAKVNGEDVAAYGKLSRDDRYQMLQTLLAERFHLKAHIEKREMPVYELVVAKGGAKLKEATAAEADKAMTLSRERGKVEAVSSSIESLPWILSNEVGRPVVDKTGLKGRYDYTLDYVPTTKAATDETGGPSVFTALEEQLGLRLEPAKEPMDVLVIDSVEQPAAN